MGIKNQMGRVLGQNLRGMTTAHEMWNEMANILEPAIENRDPELSETIALALGHTELRLEDIGYLAGTAFRVQGLGLTRQQPDVDLQDLVTDRVTASLKSETDPVERARLLGAIPPQWCERAWLTQALKLPMDDPSRIAVIHHLLGALQHHETELGAWQMVVEQHLDVEEPAAAITLVAAGYLRLHTDQRRNYRARKHLLEYMHSLDSDLLLDLSMRFSIEVHDDSAALTARCAIERGLPAYRLPVAAIILWIAGDRDEAVAALPSSDDVDYSWWTAAAQSLALFIQASVSPAATQLNLLVNPPSEELVKQPATVGALVGRLAHMRMCIYNRLGNIEESLVEAQAVVSAYGYREYDLHAQGRNSEFDVRLVNRLAVTPDEVHEARALLASSTISNPIKWFIIEGKLIRQAPTATSH